MIAGLALARGASAADEVKKTDAPPPRSFYKKFFAPQMDSHLHGEKDAALEYASPTANPWIRDHRVVTRVENDALNATRDALKKYAIERLHLDTMSIPLFQHAQAGLDAAGSVDPRVRLRLSVARMVPKAELIVPSARGKFTFASDALGRVDLGFDAASYRMGFRAGFDPREHSASVALGYLY